MTDPHLIVLDLDDTMLDNLHELNRTSVRVLLQLQLLGHKVMIATARPPCLTLPHYRTLNLDTPVSCLNGALLYHPQDPAFPAVKKALTGERLEHILRLLAETSPESVWAEDGDDLYVTNPIRSGAYFKELTRSCRLFPLDLRGTPLPAASRIIAIVPDSAHTHMQVQKLRAVDGVELITRRWKHGAKSLYLSVSGAGADKWFGALEVAQYYGVPPKNIVAFGDEYNDAKMIQNAGIGFVMKNGNPELVQKARRVTALTNSEGGVGYELSRLFELDLPGDGERMDESP